MIDLFSSLLMKWGSLMVQDNGGIVVRRANINDNFKKIAELLYKTDPYIYPYWFGSLKNCINELTPLLLEKKFFFYYKNLFVAIKDNNIVGVVCIVDKSTDLNYDYSKLKSYNERYCFTIVNYIEGLIKEVENADFAYISNVCVDEHYRGMHIGNYMVNTIIEIYKNDMFKKIVLDCLADNPGAIKLYQNLGFEKFTEIFKGFNNPKKEKPDVFSMMADLE